MKKIVAGKRNESRKEVVDEKRGWQKRGRQKSAARLKPPEK